MNNFLFHSIKTIKNRAPKEKYKKFNLWCVDIFLVKHYYEVMIKNTYYTKCFESHQRVYAAFWGRGKATNGELGHLNCAFNKHIDHNETLRIRSEVAQTMGNSFENKIFGVTQKHTCDVHILKQSNLTDLVEADAIITQIPNILIGVLTADCCPILIYEPRESVVAVIHAGWRGAFGKSYNECIISNTIKQIVNLGCKVENVMAALGPCITVDSYQVGEEFVANFLERDIKYKVFFTSKQDNGSMYFDLPSFVIYKLNELGVQNIDASSSKDTLSNPEQYFSYRRAYQKCKQNQKPKYGCQISVIGMA